MVNIIFYSNPLYHSVVAVYQGVTTKDLYAQYGLSLDDWRTGAKFFHRQKQTSNKKSCSIFTASHTYL